MTWELFYLLVFFVGLGLALGSALLGMHHGFGHHGGFGHAGGHDFGAHSAGGHAAGHHGGSSSSSGDGVSPFNLMTLAAFLLWFGGAGYILTTVYAWLALLTLGLSAVAGLIGGFVVFVFLARVLIPGQTHLNPNDYRLIGTVGHLSNDIRAGGTGEIVYVQGGTRKSLGARHRGGEVIPKGTEVVILEYQNGIAYVEPVDKYIRS